MPRPSGSDRVDLPLRRLPEDELELLAVFGAVGVRTADIGMRVVGGSVALGCGGCSSTLEVTVSTGAGVAAG